MTATGGGPFKVSFGRRKFLQGAVGVAVSTPTLSAILAACGGSASPSPSGSSQAALPGPNNPITLPLNGKSPIAAGTPFEQGATLLVYNWASYMWPGIFKRFEQQYASANVKVQLATFNSEEEAISKMSAGAIQPDVYIPQVFYMQKLALASLLQPLNHGLIPNLAANVWSVFQNPWYDQGWRFSVPYTIFDVGIGYRRDHITDADVQRQGWQVLSNPAYKGRVGVYDNYRTTMAPIFLKNGIKTINPTDQNDINVAKNDLIKMIGQNGLVVATDIAYAKLPAGQVWACEAFSGDVIGATLYGLPKGVSKDVIGFYQPDPKGGTVGNDMMVIPASAQHPRLAHEFLNFMLDANNALANMTNYTGYQPPQNSIDPSSLVPSVVPATASGAIVTKSLLNDGQYQLPLPANVDAIWAAAWAQVKAGG